MFLAAVPPYIMLVMRREIAYLLVLEFISLGRDRAVVALGHKPPSSLKIIVLISALTNHCILFSGWFGLCLALVYRYIDYIIDIVFL